MRFTFNCFHQRFFFCFVLAALVGWTTLGAAAEWRTWSSKVGTEVEAQVISQTETHVVLKTKAGAQLNVEKVKLSDNDQEFLKWLADDAKKPAAKPKSTAKPEKTPELQPADESSAAKKATSKPAAKGESKAAPEKPASKSSAPAKDDPKKPGVKADPLKLETPQVLFPLSSDTWKKQKSLADPPNTDYAKLTRELIAPAERPKFVQINKFKLPLVSPERAILAQASNMLIDYDEKNDRLDVYDLDTGKRINSLKVGPLANPRCFALSPSGKYLGFGKPDNSVAVFDVATGKGVLENAIFREEKKKLVRLAFNWNDDEYALLSDKPEIDRWLIHHPVGKRHTFSNAIPDVARDWLANNDEIWLTVTGQDRIGARLHERFSYATYCQKQEAGFKAHAHRAHLAFPVRSGLVYWSPRELTRYVVSFSTKPSEPKQQSKTNQHRAIDCLDFAKHSLDREDRYLWVTNEAAKDTLDIYDLECFDIPLRVQAPPQKKTKQLHWHSAETRRLYYYDPASTEITVYELQNFAPQTCWKVFDTFHRALLDKRYDRLDGLAAELAKDMRSLPGSRQLPVLTDVILSFSRLQFLVPRDEWLERLEVWEQERPDSTFAKLVNASIFIQSATMQTKNDRPRKNELPNNPVVVEHIKEAERLLKHPLAAKVPWGETLYLQLRLASLQGWEKDKMLELSAHLAKIAPEHTEFHHEMCQQLLPEVRGDDGDTELYAKTIADHFLGEQGDILYGRMATRWSRRYDSEEFFRQFKFDWDRATRGLLADAKKKPEDPAKLYRVFDWYIYYTFANRAKQFANFEKDYDSIKKAYSKLMETHGLNVYQEPRTGTRYVED
jgi:hypothetical protein